jgi:two-component system cell cycle response regulator
MQTANPQNGNGALVESSNHSSSRKVLLMERRARSADQSLESSLSAALLAADTEFGDILQEVDKISQILKSDVPDEQTLRVAVHPAVWSAVKQALVDRELRHLALTDDLTCLYNRRGFFAAGTQLLKLAARNSQGLLFLFCDFDKLKRINDTHGHREGDLALIRTADALERSFRGADIVARIGGDEFVVLALESSAQSQEVILRRLAKNLKKANAGDSRSPLSLSIGVARFDPKHPLSLADLMLQADQAMYEEKRKRQKFSNPNPASESSM